MRVDEKLVSKIQKYMFIFVLLLLAVVVVRFVFMNGVLIKSANTDILAENPGFNHVYSYNSPYDDGNSSVNGTRGTEQGSTQSNRGNQGGGNAPAPQNAGGNNSNNGSNSNVTQAPARAQAAQAPTAKPKVSATVPSTAVKPTKVKTTTAAPTTASPTKGTTAEVTQVVTEPAEEATRATSSTRPHPTRPAHHEGSTCCTLHTNPTGETCPTKHTCPTDSTCCADCTCHVNPSGPTNATTATEATKATGATCCTCGCHVKPTEAATCCTLHTNPTGETCPTWYTNPTGADGSTAAIICTEPREDMEAGESILTEGGIDAEPSEYGAAADGEAWDEERTEKDRDTDAALGEGSSSISGKSGKADGTSTGTKAYATGKDKGYARISGQSFYSTSTAAGEGGFDYTTLFLVCLILFFLLVEGLIMYFRVRKKSK